MNEPIEGRPLRIEVHCRCSQDSERREAAAARQPYLSEIISENLLARAARFLTMLEAS
jgi:hypothetical protein